MDILTIILVGAVCLALGILMGLMLARLFRPRPTVTKKPVVSGRGGLVEVARFWLEEERKRYFPEIDGKLIRAGADLTNEQRKKLLGLIEYLRGGEGSAAEQTGANLKGMEPQPVTGMGTEFAKLETAPPDSKQRVSLLGSIGKALTPDARKTTATEKSIAAQIDDILQEKLDGNPLENKAIRIMELPNKGMVVLVGLDQYPGVNEVPDAEVRAIIGEAVQEWERRTAGEEI